MEVHQVLVSASVGDPVTTSALDLEGRLRQLGSSETFARRVDPALGDRVLPLEQYAERSRSDGADLIVYHVSVDEPSVSSFLRQRSEPLAVVYHSVPPFEPRAHDEAAPASRPDAVREMMTALAVRVDLAVAGTELDAAELRASGSAKVVLSPIAACGGALVDVPPDPDMAAYLACFDGPLFLFVGQLLPRNRLDWLLAAYHILVTYLEPHAHLLVVGAESPTMYRRALDTFVAELNLSRAHLVGSVTQESLAACYSVANAFVTASEDEGLCLPALEAMAFEVPVLARAFGAIPETVGGGGLLLGAADGPSVAAEAMAELVHSEKMRAELASRGRRRLRELDPDVARAELVAELRSVVA
jgi:L-malate glycosyltransferase